MLILSFPYNNNNNDNDNNNNNNNDDDAVESHGPINRDALQFLSELGRRLVETTGDVRALSFLFQRISVVVQRFNLVLLHDGFVDDDRPE